MKLCGTLIKRRLFPKIHSLLIATDTPVIEMCFEIDEELRSELDCDAVGEDVWGHISKHGVTIVKYHDGRYALGAEINRLLNEQRNKSESAFTGS